MVVVIILIIVVIVLLYQSTIRDEPISELRRELQFNTMVLVLNCRGDYIVLSIGVWSGLSNSSTHRSTAFPP
ncbi:hypothetical protein BJ742DRAFT_829500, partial [Cladochytrium replicatum]